MSDEEQQGFKFSQYGEARLTDPETSHIAAVNVKAGALEHKVLDCLVAWGPLTIKELIRRGDFAIESISPRFAPLRRKGAIRDSGVRRLNPGSTREGIVWEITDIGRAAQKRG